MPSQNQVHSRVLHTLHTFEPQNLYSLFPVDFNARSGCTGPSSTTVPEATVQHECSLKFQAAACTTPPKRPTPTPVNSNFVYLLQLASAQVHVAEWTAISRMARGTDQAYMWRAQLKRMPLASTQEAARTYARDTRA
jgi:hypothetical protein